MNTIDNKGISVIIPCHNDGSTLAKCLESIYTNRYSNYEVIVADDNSGDNSLSVANSFSCHAIRAEKNIGAGGARNLGANIAKKEILLFIDADAVIEKDLFERLNKQFTDDRLNVIMGVMDKVPANNGFIPSLLALEANFYHSYKDTARDEVHTFAFAIKKDVFDSVGGFDSTFKIAGGEEYEFGYKLNKKGYILNVDSGFKVKHHFDNFKERTKKVFKRSINWAHVFTKQKRFGTKGTGIRAGLSKIFGSLFLIMLAISVLYPRPFIVYMGFICLGIELALMSNFLGFIYREKGLWYLLKSLFPLHFWALVITVGIAIGFLKILFKRIKTGAYL